MNQLVTVCSKVLKYGGTALIFCSFEQFPVYLKIGQEKGLTVEKVPIVVVRKTPIASQVRTNFLKNMVQLVVVMHKLKSGTNYYRNLSGKVSLKFSNCKFIIVIMIINFSDIYFLFSFFF